MEVSSASVLAKVCRLIPEEDTRPILRTFPQPSQSVAEDEARAVSPPTVNDDLDANWKNGLEQEQEKVDSEALRFSASNGRKRPRQLITHASVGSAGRLLVGTDIAHPSLEQVVDGDDGDDIASALAHSLEGEKAQLATLSGILSCVWLEFHWSPAIRTREDVPSRFKFFGNNSGQKFHTRKNAELIKQQIHGLGRGVVLLRDNFTLEIHEFDCPKRCGLAASPTKAVRQPRLSNLRSKKSLSFPRWPVHLYIDTGNKLNLEETASQSAARDREMWALSSLSDRDCDDGNASFALLSATRCQVLVFTIDFNQCTVSLQHDLTLETKLHGNFLKHLPISVPLVISAGAVWGIMLEDTQLVLVGWSATTGKLVAKANLDAPVGIGSECARQVKVSNNARIACILFQSPNIDASDHIIRIDLDAYFQRFPWHCLAHLLKIDDAPRRELVDVARVIKLFRSGELKMILSDGQSWIEGQMTHVAVASYRVPLKRSAPEAYWSSAFSLESCNLLTVLSYAITSERGNLVVIACTNPCSGNACQLLQCGADDEYFSPIASELEQPSTIIRLQSTEEWFVESEGHLWYLFTDLSPLEEMDAEEKVLCTLAGRSATLYSYSIGVLLCKLNGWQKIEERLDLITVQYLLHTGDVAGACSVAQKTLDRETASLKVENASFLFDIARAILAYIRCNWRDLQYRPAFERLVECASACCLFLIEQLAEENNQGSEATKRADVAQWLIFIQELAFYTNHRGSRRGPSDPNAFVARNGQPAPFSDTPKIEFHWKSGSWNSFVMSAPHFGEGFQSGSESPKASPAAIARMIPASLRSRWSTLSDSDIVREALISGQTSSAIALLWLRANRSDAAMKLGHGVLPFLDNLVGVDEPASRYFQKVARHQIYRLLCNDQMDYLFLSARMLRNMGENVSAFLKHVAMHTSRRMTRWRLLAHVEHTAGISKSEVDCADLLSTLEALYPSPSFMASSRRLTSMHFLGEHPRAPNVATDVKAFADAHSFENERTTRDQSDVSAIHAAASSRAIYPLILVSHRAPMQQGDSARILLGRDQEGPNSSVGAPRISQFLTNRHRYGPVFAAGENELSLQSDLDDHGIRGVEDVPGAAAFLEGTMLSTQDPSLPHGNGIEVPKEDERAALQLAALSDDKEDAAMVCEVCTKNEGGKWSHAWKIGPQHMVWESTRQHHGYLHLSLTDVQRWSQETRERVLIDAGYRLEERSFLVLLRYCIDHLDWSNAAALIRLLAVCARHVDERGVMRTAIQQDMGDVEANLCRWTLSHVKAMECEPKPSDEMDYDRLLACSVTVVIDALKTSPPFLDKYLRDCFATKGLILVSNALDSSVQDGPGHSLKAALDNGTLPLFFLEAGERLESNAAFTVTKQAERTIALLSSARALFVAFESTESDSALVHILPQGHVSWLHKNVITTLCQQNRIALLKHYLDHYKLALTRDALNELEKEGVLKCSDPAMAAMLLQRVANDWCIAEASFHEAYRVFGLHSLGSLFCIDSSTNVKGANGKSENANVDVEQMRDQDRTNQVENSGSLIAYATLCFIDESAAALLQGDAKIDLATPPRLSLSPSIPKVLMSYAALTSSARRPSHQRPVLIFENSFSSNCDTRISDFCQSLARAGGLDYFDSSLVGSKKKLAAVEVAESGGKDPDELLAAADQYSSDNGQLLEQYRIAEELEPESNDTEEYFGSPGFGVEYCLLQGRGSQAFTLFVKEEGIVMEDLEKGAPSALVAERAYAVSKAAVYRHPVPILSSANNDATGGVENRCLLACCWFLHLLSLPTHVLCVDCAALETIVAFHPAKLSRASVRSLFCKLPSYAWQSDDESPTPVDNAPKESKLEGVASNSQAQSSSGEQLTALKWLGEAALLAVEGGKRHHRLESLFCKVHHLPLSVAFLHELARDNDFLGFLYEAQIHDIPPRTALSIIRDSFTDVVVREHVALVTAACSSGQVNIDALKELSLGGHVLCSGRDISNPRIGPKKMRDNDTSEGINDLAVFLGQENGKGLLREAVRLKAPRFCVIATGFSDVSLNACWLAWLTCRCEKLSEGIVTSEVLDENASPAEESRPPEDPGVDDVATETVPSETVWPSDENEHLAKTIVFLLRHGLHEPLLSSLHIFQPPGSPLAHFCLFYHAFVSRKAYPDAEKYLSHYASNLAEVRDAEKQRSDDAASGLIFFHEKVAVPELLHLFRQSRIKADENSLQSRFMLLEMVYILSRPSCAGLLREARINFGLLYKVCLLLEKDCDIPVTDLHVLATRSTLLVKRIIERHLFDQARQLVSLVSGESGRSKQHLLLKSAHQFGRAFDKQCGIECISMTCQEAADCLEEIILSEASLIVTTQYSATSLHEPVWSRCSALFKEQSLPPPRAQFFFLSCISALRRKPVEARELAQLYGLLVEWLSIEISNSSRAASSASSGPYAARGTDIFSEEHSDVAENEASPYISFFSEDRPTFLESLPSERGNPMLFAAQIRVLVLACITEGASSPVFSLDDLPPLTAMMSSDDRYAEFCRAPAVVRTVETVGKSALSIKQVSAAVKVGKSVWKFVPGVVDDLVNHGKLQHASLVAEHFGDADHLDNLDFSSVPIARFAVRVANLAGRPLNDDEASLRARDADLQKIVATSRFEEADFCKVSSSSADSSSLSAAIIFKKLRSLCPQIRPFLSKVTVSCKVAQLLGGPVNGFSYSEICKYGRGYQFVGKILDLTYLGVGDGLFFKSMLQTGSLDVESSSNRTPADFNEAIGLLLSSTSAASHKDDISGAWSKVESSAFGLLKALVKHFAPLDGDKIALLLCDLVCRAGEKDSIGVGYLHQDSRDSTNKNSGSGKCTQDLLVLLGESDLEAIRHLLPGSLVRSLGNIAFERQQLEEYSLAMRVELAILSYKCLLQALDEEGLEAFFMNIKKSLVGAVVATGRFGLLVRLITGTEAYDSLDYIFGILRANNRLSIAVHVANYLPSFMQRAELKMRLDRHVRSCDEMDIEELVACYSALDLPEQLAWLLFERAVTITVKVVAKISQILTSSDLRQEMTQSLLLVKQLYLLASKYFGRPDSTAFVFPVKQKAESLQLRALAQARLVGLQLDLLNRADENEAPFAVLGLDPPQAQALLESASLLAYSAEAPAVVRRAYHLL